MTEDAETLRLDVPIPHAVLDDCELSERDIALMCWVAVEQAIAETVRRYRREHA